MKKEQRYSEKNNIMKSFFGVVAFGLMCRISFYVQANKEINDMSWGNNASKYSSTKTFILNIYHCKLQALPIFNLTVRNVAICFGPSIKLVLLLCECTNLYS